MRSLRQNGETIIEVMLSVVILGFTITTIFLIARESLDTGQAANERSQVLAMIESQTERMKYLAEVDNPSEDKNIFLDSNPFCVDAQLVVHRPPTAACNAVDFPDAGLVIEIVWDEDGPDDTDSFDDSTFTLTANWTKINDTTTENLTTAYRLHKQEPPVDPPLNCGINGDFNLGREVSTEMYPAGSVDPASGKTYKDQWGAFDVLYNSSSDNEAPKFIRSASNPDFIIEPTDNIIVNENCTYSATYETFCTTPFVYDPTNPNPFHVYDLNLLDETSIQQPPPRCYREDRQSSYTQINEAAMIILWDNRSSDNYQNPGNGYSYLPDDYVNAVQCQGNVLSYFFTGGNPDTSVAGLLTSTVWTGVVDPVIVNEGEARCLEVVHICRASEYAIEKGFTIDGGVPLPNPPCNNTTSSVHFQDLDWIR